MTAADDELWQTARSHFSDMLPASQPELTVDLNFEEFIARQRAFLQVSLLLRIDSLLLVATAADQNGGLGRPRTQKLPFSALDPAEPNHQDCLVVH